MKEDEDTCELYIVFKTYTLLIALEKGHFE